MTPTTDDVAGLVAELRNSNRTPYACLQAAALLESQAKALREAEALAKQLSDALLTVRPLGGSELFINRNGNYYADPEYLKAAIRSDHDSRHKAMCEGVRANRRALAAEARLKEAEKVIEPFSDAEADLAVDARDEWDLWEAPASGSITVAHLRAARAFLNAEEK